MYKFEERRKISIGKVKNAMVRLRVRDGELIDYDALAVQVASQLNISMKNAKEYVKLAKFQLGE